MEFWPEFLASSWGREFVAGGLGGMAGVVAGYPFDTLRIRIQQPAGRAVDGCRPSATALFRSILRSEGPAALYRGMAAPLASVAFQNAMVFQVYAVLSRACDLDKKNEPPSYKSVALGGFGTGALQSFLLSPVELVKIRLQLQTLNHHHHSCGKSEGPLTIAKRILQTEGLRGIYRGFAITILRDAPAHAVYFWTYEYAREHLHPGCRKRADESLGTMLIAGGLAGVASWVCCYPLDVVKSRLQAQSPPRGSRPPPRYNGIIDCFQKSVREEGYSVLWRGLGTAITRAFVVNGAIFSAYELALRFLVNGGQRISLEKS
ncbi:mitochondrial arginine transporter BAC2 [Dendrobium catenatum]|uniref:mitochondrial arginine transporter BAC2 n=1 Tax=Dendrobium catenatum TaxID=906689 RepID=UPI00109F13F1|nr:mitochondrial arginine transporter BAC2 [Dendrobium catenatum]